MAYSGLRTEEQDQNAPSEQLNSSMSPTTAMRSVKGGIRRGTNEAVTPSEARTITATGHNENIVEEQRLATPIDMNDQEEKRPISGVEADAIVDKHDDASEKLEKSVSATDSRADSRTVVHAGHGDPNSQLLTIEYMDEASSVEGSAAAKVVDL